MNPAISAMLSRYECRTEQDFTNALKEIIQECALMGLWRANFFDQAAFYGGTALRIIYGLDRFSEDLDFSLLTPQKDFRLNHYLQSIKEELKSFGLEISIEEKQKTKQTAIASAFIKAGTQEHLLNIEVPAEIATKIYKGRLLTIKLEVDTDPPGDFETEIKTLLLPIPFAVRVFQQPDLFAGKIHAILMRNWGHRVKGRDYYDFIWYVARKTPLHLKHLQTRLLQSPSYKGPNNITHAWVLEALRKKFETIDFESAKSDVIPFLRDADATRLWSKEFFISLLDQLKVI